MADLMNQNTEVQLRVDQVQPALLETLSNLGSQVQPNGTKISLLVDNESIVPEIATAVAQHGAKLYELTPRHKSLEDIFVSIIGSDVGDGR